MSGYPRFKKIGLPFLGGLLLLALLLFGVLQPAGAGSPEMNKLAQQSTFIFIGTVKQVQAATMKTVPVDDHTVIVHIEAVLDAPKSLTNFAGQDITVQLHAGPVAKVGSKAVFYTNGWQYGSSLAVREVGRTEAKADVATYRKQIAAAVQLRTDQKIHARISSAVLIVSGKVTEITTPKLTKPKPIDFDDPHWADAHVLINKVEKGKYTGKTVIVTFPTSKDARWYRSPHFKVGDEGVFVLHKRNFPYFGREGYVALHPNDFHAKPQVEHIRTLIKVGPAGTTIK